MSQICPLEGFDCEGDPASVGLRWEKWKRAIDIYLLAANIDKPAQKRATLLHTVQRQLDNFDPTKTLQASQTVHRIEAKNKRMTSKPCTRCGSDKHSADYNNCPARDKKCLKCGFLGHFRSQCRTRVKKRKATTALQKDNKKKKSDYNENTKTEIDYIFHLDDDEVITCQVGGVNIEMLIDSGSKCNIINDTTWHNLKRCKIKIYNQVKSPEKMFKAYGSQNPLTVLGSFEAKVMVGTETTTDTFYVVKDGERNLLGKKTATALGVLKIGLNINTINDGPFPKFKDVIISIPIDKSVRPVCQPYRRVPIPLEEKINNKIQELIRLDIIEKVNSPSSWISPMVPVLKGDGDVRICIDMRRANKAIIRENHPLPRQTSYVWYHMRS